MSCTLNQIEENLARLQKAWPGRRTFNARIVSSILDIKYCDTLAMIRQGVFPAWKVSGTWEVPIQGEGTPVEWARNRRYDTARKYMLGHVPLEELLAELKPEESRGIQK
jgi:hypothetical protein